MSPTVPELETRVAALEAAHAESLTAPAAGAQAERLAARLDRHEQRFDLLEQHLAERFQDLMTAINTLGAQSRERQDQQDLRIERVEQQIRAADARSRSVEESLAEIKDMLVRALDRG
jgi:chromosome segregation ATPase